MAVESAERTYVKPPCRFRTSIGYVDGNISAHKQEGRLRMEPCGRLSVAGEDDGEEGGDLRTGTSSSSGANSMRHDRGYCLPGQGRFCRDILNARVDSS